MPTSVPRALVVGLVLLSAHSVSAHQRLPDAREWTDFPTQRLEGTFVRRVRAPSQLKLRLNFEPELQKSDDHL